MSVDPLKANAMPHADPGCVPEGAVSPERMREVLRRLELGHYNSAEVLEKVAHAVRQDLSLDPITSATSGSA